MAEILNEEVRLAVDASVLCWLATVSPEGMPSVSPKEVFSIRDDQLLIANIKSPNSARNIAANPNVCVSFLDILVQKGLQLYGHARVIKKNDPTFQSLAEPLLEITEGIYPFATLFAISPTEIKPIVAPRYTLYPETTEEEQIRSAQRAYGIKLAERQQ